MLDWALGQTQAAGGRAAWLCASHARRTPFRRTLAATGQQVYRLRAGDDTTVEPGAGLASGHLITAGRYDGLDLAGDICRLVIITTVPQASSEFERFVVAYLGDATFMRHRVGQRVTQALGRANRTSTDRSLYLGLDPSFAQMLADPAVRASIPAGTQPIVRAALETLRPGLGRLDPRLRTFWQPAAQPTAARSRRRSGTAPATAPGRSTGGSGEVASADAEVSAATDLWIGDHARAAGKAREAADLLAAAGETEHAAFWRYIQAHALLRPRQARGPRRRAHRARRRHR